MTRILKRIIGGILFFSFFIIGIASIIILKFIEFDFIELEWYYVAIAPCIVLAIYALVALMFLLMGAIQDNDQIGDNCYYLGFLYTLTSLAVSFFELDFDPFGTSFESSQTIAKILPNFGIAVFSTIAGIFLRALYQQFSSTTEFIGLHDKNLAQNISEAIRKAAHELNESATTISDFRAESKKMVESLKSLNKELTGENSVINQILIKIDKLDESLSEISLNLKKDNNENLERILDNLNNSINSNSGNTETANKFLENIDQKVSSLNFSEITSLLTKNSQELDLHFKNLNKLLDEIKILIQSEESGATNNIFKCMESILENLQNLNETFSTNKDRLSNIIQCINNIETLASNEKEKNTEHISQLIKVVNSLESVKTLVEKFGKNIVGIEPLIRNLEESQQGNNSESKEIRSILGRILSTLKNIKIVEVEGPLKRLIRRINK